jgi:hypothetical protein
MMMHTAIKTALGLLLSATMVPAVAQAGEAVMTWQNPEKFTDIEPGNGTQRSFSKGLERTLNKELGKMAADLPAGYTFEIDFTDIDLAGEVDPVQLPGTHQLRLLKEVYFPALRFDYRVLDAGGVAVAEQKDVRIKDMSYLSGASQSGASADFYYETRLLKRWFSKELLPGLK